MTPRLKELYYKEIQPALKEKLGFKNTFQGPKVLDRKSTRLNSSHKRIEKQRSDENNFISPWGIIKWLKKVLK